MEDAFTQIYMTLSISEREAARPCFIHRLVSREMKKFQLESMSFEKFAWLEANLIRKTAPTFHVLDIEPDSVLCVWSKRLPNNFPNHFTRMLNSKLMNIELAFDWRHTWQKLRGEESRNCKFLFLLRVQHNGRKLIALPRLLSRGDLPCYRQFVNVIFGGTKRFVLRTSKETLSEQEVVSLCWYKVVNRKRLVS